MMKLLMRCLIYWQESCCWWRSPVCPVSACFLISVPGWSWLSWSMFLWDPEFLHPRSWVVTWFLVPWWPWNSSKYLVSVYLLILFNPTRAVCVCGGGGGGGGWMGGGGGGGGGEVFLWLNRSGNRNWPKWYGDRERNNIYIKQQIKLEERTACCKLKEKKIPCSILFRSRTRPIRLDPDRPPPPPHPPPPPRPGSDVALKDVKEDGLMTAVGQSSGTVWTGRWDWAVIPYPILSPSLRSRTVSVDVKHHEREETAVAGLRAQERLRARR